MTAAPAPVLAPVLAGPPRSFAPDAVSAQPRAQGEAKVRLGAGGLRGLRQQGSAKCFLPRVEGAPVAVLLNTAGGLTGGDRFAYAAEAEAGAFLTVTTQAAERVYRAQPGEVAEVRAQVTLGAGARLDWLPQETILFDGGALDRRLEIDMAEDARFLGVEPLTLGRAAMGETVTDARFRDAWRLRRGGRLVWADGLRLLGDAAAIAAGPATFAGARAAATVVYAAPDAEDRLGGFRACLTGRAAASALDGLLIARFLGEDGFALRRALAPALEHLRGAPLPRVWTM
ncbi:MAG: urease accessory protein UreD [Pseudomonadota bacterium]